MLEFPMATFDEPEIVIFCCENCTAIGGAVSPLHYVNASRADFPPGAWAERPLHHLTVPTQSNRVLLIAARPTQCLPDSTCR